MTTEARFDQALRILVQNEVDFVVVGGVGAILQGSPLSTEDLDVVYLSSEENHRRLIGALKQLEASYLDPAGRHIEPDLSRLSSMRMHLLKTNCGRVDVMREIGNELGYEEIVERSTVFQVENFRVRVLDLEAIIETKQHANRPKDQYQLPFLRQLLSEIRRRDHE